MSTVFWWSSPYRYYSYRKTYADYDDLAENQGICVNETELRYMTQQDCYNWCMSLEYDDYKCANDCGWSGSGGKEIFDPKLILVFAVAAGACVTFCICYICVTTGGRKATL